MAVTSGRVSATWTNCRSSGASDRKWVASANQINLPPGYPNAEKKIGFEWTYPSRFNRIKEVLSADRKFGLEDFDGASGGYDVDPSAPCSPLSFMGSRAKTRALTSGS